MEMKKSSRTKDLTNQKFGKLLVISRAEPRITSKYKHSMWSYVCECGKHGVAQSCNLLCGNTKSCGCSRSKPFPLQTIQARRKRKPPNPLVSIRIIICAYKTNAKKRGFAWDLSFEEFVELAALPCHYCGAGPSNFLTARFGHYTYMYNGIDRLNSELGYFRDNCVPSCKFCNWAKSARTVTEFTAWIIRVYDHLNIQSTEKIIDDVCNDVECEV